MLYRKQAVLLAVTGALWTMAGGTPVVLAEGGMPVASVGGGTPAASATMVFSAKVLADNDVDPLLADSSAPLSSPGWNRMSDGSWCWVREDGTLHKGWLQDNGRVYYMNEDGVMTTGWEEVEGEWYYFHQDGGMNLGELILDNGKYEFSDQGALTFAGWVENTGGGAYDAGCYDDEAQALFDQLNEEKREQYLEEYPDREDEYGGDMHRVYDRYAGFQMDMTLNKAAAHRLEAADAGGYADDGIPGEGTISDYLTLINYRRNASCLELYVQDCEDSAEAYDKVEEKLDKRFQAKTDRKYSLEYYRRLGMAHKERDGTHYFMIILMR